MQKFKHLILTRFNVRSSIGFDKFVVDYSQTIHNQSWLKSRFELFDKFCFPSVKSQTNQNFTWLVFFDIDTPQEYRQLIQEKYAHYSNFVPIYLEDFSLEKLKQDIREVLKTTPEYLITTRIDNDDAMSNNYIELIQNQFQEQDFQFINFYHGYQLHEPTGKLYSRGRVCNPFISLIEKTEDFKTVWLDENYPHFRIFQDFNPIGKLKNVYTESHPTWLQVIHEKNVANKIEGLRQPRKNLLKQYTFNLDVNLDAPESSLDILLERQIKYIKDLPIFKIFPEAIANIRIKLSLKTRLKNLLHGN